MFRFSSPAARFPYATGAEASPSPAGFTEWKFDGRLRAIKRAPAEGQTRWLVFFNGNAEHQLESGAAFLTRVGGARGLATFAYRGYEGSEGAPSPEALRADAVKFVEALGVSPASLELAGFSLGAPLAVHVAAELSRRGTPPAKLTILAGALELSMLQPSRWASLLRGDVYEIGTDDAKALRCPVVVLHGADDVTLRPNPALAQRLGATLSLLNGVDHHTILKVAELTP
jgi:pimeloyl-ACP methyl ester carboxylesterase